MKKDTHPQYYPKAKISCACGHAFEVGSSVPEISIEICSNCHPFYTGKQKLVDSARRVEKFTERSAKKTEMTGQGGKKAKKIKRTAQKASKKPKMEVEKA